MIPLLEGIRVVSLCKLIPADLTSQWLADLGAEVIKVEQPPLGDYMRDMPTKTNDVGHQFLMMNRNKRSLSLNLRQPEGMRVLRELVATADVFVEVSRPGLPDERGFGYDALRQVKADLVYCSVSGYGQSGPFRNLPSHGIGIDGACAAYQVERRPDGRPELRWPGINGVTPGMVGTGSLGVYAALTILAAVIRARSSGDGCLIDASCWDAGVYAMGTQLGLVNLVNNGEPYPAWSPLSSKHNVFRTKDDKVVFLAPIERKFWDNFAQAAGREDWVGRGQWETSIDRGHADPELYEEMAAVVETKTQAEWMALGDQHDFPVSPVLSLEELIDAPQSQARQVFSDVEHPAYGRITLLGFPMKVQGMPFEPRYAPPVLGEHTDEILASLGYDEAAREELREAGAV